MADRSTLYRDLLFFVKNDLKNNVSDPLNSRSSNSQFVMTSFPQRYVEYPLITLRIANLEGFRAGMQTDRLDINLTFELRIWAKSVTQRDKLTQQLLDRLASIQFSASGSIDSDFHDFNILSSLDVDEEKLYSKVIQVQYRFFDA